MNSGPFLPKNALAAEWGPVSPDYSWTHAALLPELAALRAQASAAPEDFFATAHRMFFRALHAQSPNTQRAYACDWRVFVRFCRQHGYPALPATPAALEAFIEGSAEFAEGVPYKYIARHQPRRNVKASSITRAVAAIGAVHTWLQFPNPAAHPDVKHTLKINTRGRSAKQPKAPLLWASIERALAAYGDSLPALRAKALVTVAFSTLLRRSELMALCMEDVRFSLDSDDGTVRVRHSKGDQAGVGEERYLTAIARRELERWLAAAQLRSGPVFARLNRNGLPLAKPLHSNQVALIFKDVARRAGLPEHEVARIAGHSTRIGATHELGRHGASLPELMRAGGWLSPQMPATYLRESSVKSGAMAKWSRRQHPSVQLPDGVRVAEPDATAGSDDER